MDYGPREEEAEMNFNLKEQYWGGFAQRGKESAFQALGPTHTEGGKLKQAEGV